MMNDPEKSYSLPKIVRDALNETYYEIKYPFARLTHGENRIFFFEDIFGSENTDQPIIAFNDIPCNWPSLVFTAHTVEDAYKTIKYLVEEGGWTLHETTLKELNYLISE